MTKPSMRMRITNLIPELPIGWENLDKSGNSGGLFCTVYLFSIGKTILELWVLEGSNASALSRNSSLQTSITTFICCLSAGLLILP